MIPVQGCLVKYWKCQHLDAEDTRSDRAVEILEMSETKWSTSRLRMLNQATKTHHQRMSNNNHWVETVTLKQSSGCHLSAGHFLMIKLLFLTTDSSLVASLAFWSKLNSLVQINWHQWRHLHWGKGQFSQQHCFLCLCVFNWNSPGSSYFFEFQLTLTGTCVERKVSTFQLKNFSTFEQQTRLSVNTAASAGIHLDF